MTDRPLEDVRPFGPFIETDGPLVEGDKDVQFESLSDLPDSPMLRQYVERMKEKTGKSEKTVINSRPVKSYMKELGVWEQV